MQPPRARASRKMMNDDDDDDDSDDDVFTGSYKIAKKSVSRDELLEALPPKLASQRSKIEDSLLATLPQDLSQCLAIKI